MNLPQLKPWPTSSLSLFLTAFFGFLLSANTSRAIEVTELRSEYLVNPIGLDTRTPRLSWTMQSSRRGETQSAYQVLAAGSAENLARDYGDLWNSGKVKSDLSVQVPYAGTPLQSQQRVYWKVRVWDRSGKRSHWSRPAVWSMGLLEPGDWQGSWIGATDRLQPLAAQTTNDSSQPGPGNAAVLLRRDVSVRPAVRRATVYLCGLGYYELYLNGKKVGDHVLDPGFTDFSRRVLYVTYDVTDQLKPGQNALGVMLGGGWYHLGTPDLFGFEHAPWTASPKLRFQLVTEYANGTAETVVSDGSWKWSTGAITFNCVRGGETIDARADQPGWNLAGFDDRAWHPAVLVEAPAGRMAAQTQPPIRVTRRIRPVKLTQPKPGVFVFDLGVNIAGWARLETSGRYGQKITLEHNERLNADGTLNSGNLSSHTHGRFQTGELILRGEGREVYEPRFTYHGFQYVQVTGLTEPPSLDSLTGCWATTDPASAGEFTCSNNRINELQQMFRRTYLNNLHSIPTDCPQREKMGWLDDGCVVMETAFYNFDSPQFYTKWFGDMLDGQDRNGHLADFVPTCGWGRTRSDGAPGEMADPWWGGAIVLAPWKLYQYYADTRVLEQGYPAMKAYVDYLTTTAKDHVIEWGLGDWLDESAGGGGRRVPVAQTSTAAYFCYARIVSQTAALLGKDTDARTYAALAAATRQRFNERFLDASTGLYAKDSQTAQALPLHLGLVPADQQTRVRQGLVDSISGARKNHISAGIVGSLAVYHALLEQGRDDLAYAMITQEDYPGWLNMPNQGATTVWEAWNGEASRNHPTLGCVGFWFFQGLAGIRPDPQAPGFKQFLIKPAPVAGLGWVKATYPSLYGPITVEWHNEAGVFRLVAAVPVNTRAQIYLPATSASAIKESGRPITKSDGVKLLTVDTNRAVLTVGSGRYDFEVR